jgi:MFS family permease
VTDPVRARQRLTLLAACVGQAMILLDVTIVNVALPAIQRELGVTPANLEWVINAYSLALASLLLIGGALGDRFGRRRVYVTGIVVFTASRPRVRSPATIRSSSPFARSREWAPR